MSASETADVFDRWNNGPLESYLAELTAQVSRVIDPRSKQPLVDLVLDKAGQKGTGRWTAQIALDLAVAIPTIAAAIDARVMSSMKAERVAASEGLKGPAPAGAFAAEERADVLDDLRDALYASRICTYAQYNWNINLAEIARIWKGGCIIRARLLDLVRSAFDASPGLVNLLLDTALGDAVESAQAGWRRTLARTVTAGIPVPAHAAALAYFDSYRSPRLPQNLTQAQRDAFGAHTYVRADRPDLGPVHTPWLTLAAPRAIVPDES
jgi:6-phosphogluconate dehydrogenase